MAVGYSLASPPLSRLPTHLFSKYTGPSYPGCLPAGVDPNRVVSEETVRSLELEPNTVETLQACCDQLAAHPIALVVNFQLNPQARPFVPTAIAITLAYHHGKREEGEEHVSKHLFPSGSEDSRGDVEWDG